MASRSPAPAPVTSSLVAACLAAPARCGATRVVAIDGRSGSGKTALADQLAGALARALADALADADGDADPGEPGPVQVVHADDVYPGWDGLAAAAPLLRRWLLRPLAAGRPAGHYVYDWARGTFGGWRAVAPGGVLLIEGVGSGAAELAPYRSLLLWLQAPDGDRRARALGRDGAAFAARWERWAAQEDAYLARDDPRRPRRPGPRHRDAGGVSDAAEIRATPAEPAR